MEMITLRGKEILPYLDRISKLRITIFRQWPYLYEGNMELEKDYLKIYINSEDSTLILTKDANIVIGITMGLPIDESMEEIKQAIHTKEAKLENIYYLGEIILLKEYREKKIGIKMIQAFEKAVNELENYASIYGCEVVREDNDPRKPPHYRSLDNFWKDLGYPLVPNLHTYINWLEVESKVQTPHLMRFRKKTVTPSTSM